MKKKTVRWYLTFALAVMITMTFLGSQSSSVEAYSLKGWKMPHNMSYKTTSSYSYINSSWSQAVSTWNSEQSYRTIYYAPGSTNYLTDEYTTSSSRYGIMTTYYNSSNEVTRFYGRLNRAISSIRNVPDVRKSTGVHEIGHALGLGHSGYYAVMNTSRDRTDITTPTNDDRSGIHAIY